MMKMVKLVQYVNKSYLSNNKIIVKLVNLIYIPGIA